MIKLLIKKKGKEIDEIRHNKLTLLALRVVIVYLANCRALAGAVVDEAQARKVRTVARISCLHMGQWVSEGAQKRQVERWPQGRKTTATSLSMQILQSRASFNLRFSSSNETAFGTTNFSCYFFFFFFQLA